MAKEPTPSTKTNGANLGFEADLWRLADALRSNMDAHVVEPVGRRRHPQGDHRGRSGRLHGGAAGAAVLQHATLGRYVGAAEAEDDGEPFEDKTKRLTDELREQTSQAGKLDVLI